MKKLITLLLLTFTTLIAMGGDDIHQPQLIQLEMSTNNIKLQWSCPASPDLELFEVERESKGTNVSFTLNPFKLNRQQVVGQPETFHWTDTNVLAGVNYTYRVISHSSTHESEPSNELEGHIPTPKVGFTRGAKPIARRQDRVPPLQPPTNTPAPQVFSPPQ